MTVKSLLATSLLISALALSATAARAATVFSDGTFSPADYQLGFAASLGSATVSQAQCAACGNPGSALQLTISDSDGSNLGAAFINTSFVYDPQTQGAIGTIDASVDKNLLVTSQTGFNYGDTFRPVIEQNGNFYTAVQVSSTLGMGQTGTTTSTGYIGFSLANLTAADFSQFDTTTGLVGVAHPDFAGSTIRFGIGQVISASPLSAGIPVTVESDFDNVRIAVIGAVPEPATWAMMVGGFGLIGGAARRRRRNTGAIAA